MVGRLEAALGDGRLVVESPDFYTGCLPFWQVRARARTCMNAYASTHAYAYTHLRFAYVGVCVRAFMAPARAL